VIVGSKPHEWIAALTGVVLEDGQQPPDSDELVGKRMVAYLAHIAPKQGPNAGKLKERISQGTAKPFRLPGQKVKPTPTQVSADPSDDDVERATLVARLQKQVAKLGKLNAGEGERAQVALEESDLSDAPVETIRQLLDEVTKAVNAALDD
jgi:hypothetical protein